MIVSTPGRLAEMVFKEERVKLWGVRYVVVDEVDSLVGDTFRDELMTLLEAMPIRKGRGDNYEEAIIHGKSDGEEEGHKEHGSVSVTMDEARRKSNLPVTLCLTSATAKASLRVAELAHQLLPAADWDWVSVPQASMLPTSITHSLISVPRVKAFEMLRKVLLAAPALVRGMIFVNDPYRVKALVSDLLQRGIIAAPLSGESSKDDRKEVMRRLREGGLQLVVTTELAARGLDIPDLSHVINFELPTDSVHYVHR